MSGEEKNNKSVILTTRHMASCGKSFIIFCGLRIFIIFINTINLIFALCNILLIAGKKNYVNYKPK